MDSPSQEMAAASITPSSCRPVLLLEELQGLFRDARDLSAAPITDLRQQPVNQERDIVAPLPQRRQCYREDVKAVVEVLAERPFRDHLCEVAICGKNKADVDAPGFRATDRKKLALLDESQQLSLDLGAHVADLVEKDGAVVGRFKNTLLGHNRTREGSANMAEQLTLEKFHGECAAVDRKEALAVAGAPCRFRSRRQ